MRVYTPIKLMLAVDKVEETFPLAGAETAMLTEPELRELVLMINRKDWDELATVAGILTRREVQAICRYLRTNSCNVDLNKIEKVISLRMDANNFSILFSVWEHTPECRQALRLLGEFDRKEYRPDNFPLELGMLERWNLASRPIAAAARTIAEQNRDMPYRNRIHLMGLTYGTTLALECEKVFFSTAKLEDFVSEGDKNIEEILRRLSKADKEVILIQLLKSAANQRNALGVFSKTFHVAQALWGKPYSGSFPSNQDKAYAVYCWWYNYTELYETLHGDPRRVRFWQNYLNGVELGRNKSHHMLIMRHVKQRIVVTEFEEEGRIYIFREDYFDAVVQNKMGHNSTSTVKSWLYNESSYLRQDTHQGHWEGRVGPMLKNFGIK